MITFCCYCDRSKGWNVFGDPLCLSLVVVVSGGSGGQEKYLLAVGFHPDPIWPLAIMSSAPPPLRLE